MHTLSGEFDGGEKVVLGAGEERATEQGACLEVAEPIAVSAAAERVDEAIYEVLR